MIQDNETQQMLSRGYYTANTRSAFRKSEQNNREKTFLDIERKVTDSWSHSGNDVCDVDMTPCLLGNVIRCYTFPVFCPGLSVCDISCLIDPSLAVTYTFSCESTPQTIVVKGNWFSFMEHQFLRRFIISSSVCMIRIS